MVSSSDVPDSASLGRNKVEIVIGGPGDRAWRRAAVRGITDFLAIRGDGIAVGSSQKESRCIIFPRSQVAGCPTVGRKGKEMGVPSLPPGIPMAEQQLVNNAGFHLAVLRRLKL